MANKDVEVETKVPVSKKLFDNVRIFASTSLEK